MLVIIKWILMLAVEDVRASVFIYVLPSCIRMEGGLVACSLSK